MDWTTIVLDGLTLVLDVLTLFIVIASFKAIRDNRDQSLEAFTESRRQSSEALEESRKQSQDALTLAREQIEQTKQPTLIPLSNLPLTAIGGELDTTVPGCHPESCVKGR